MAIDSLAQIKGLVKPDEVIEPSSSSYGTESATWAAQKNLHPRLVIRPQTIASLSKVLVYLSKTSLDFAIRGHGYGSSSARDVVISTTAFDEFDFDREQEVVTLGAGQTWEAYYTKMEQVAPDYAGITFMACLKLSWSSLTIYSGCLPHARHRYWRIDTPRRVFLAFI